MKTRMIQISAAAVLVALLGGCTSRQWYESASANARSDCNRMQPGAREDCLSKVNTTPYDTYDKERSRNTP
jgi:hypothetical protein